MADTRIVAISSANWFPLSAVYPYDTNIDLQPTFIRWQDGFQTVYHPLFEMGKDVALNRESAFYLTKASSFFDVFKEIPRVPAILGSFISLSISGLYLSEIETTSLYMSAVSAIRYAQAFRLIVNNDQTFSLLHGSDKYVTVMNTLPYTLYLANELTGDNAERQRFKWFVKDDSEIIISTHFTNPNHPYGPEYIERFVSYDDTSKQLRAIGMIYDDDYTFENPYLFTVEGYDVVYAVTGLERDQTWVHYYNEFTEKSNNQNVVPFEDFCITGVKVNRLVDLPYETKTVFGTGVNTMEVNIANLKNVLTTEYEYYLKR